jgi:hypothetical protein
MSGYWVHVLPSPIEASADDPVEGFLAAYIFIRGQHIPPSCETMHEDRLGNGKGGKEGGWKG